MPKASTPDRPSALIAAPMLPSCMYTARAWSLVTVLVPFSEIHSVMPGPGLSVQMCIGALGLYRPRSHSGPWVVADFGESCGPGAVQISHPQRSVRFARVHPAGSRIDSHVT